MHVQVRDFLITVIIPGYTKFIESSIRCIVRHWIQERRNTHDSLLAFEWKLLRLFDNINILFLLIQNRMEYSVHVPLNKKSDDYPRRSARYIELLSVVG